MVPLEVELRDKSRKSLVLSFGHLSTEEVCILVEESVLTASSFLLLSLQDLHSWPSASTQKIVFLKWFSRFFLKTEFVSVTCCCAIWTPGNVQSSCVSKSLKVFWLMLVNHLLVVSRICLGKTVCTVPQMKLMHHLFLCHWCWSAI